MHDHLPGGEILDDGLRDLQAGVRSVASLLVLVAAPRLRRSGVQLPAGIARPPLPEHELYDLLVAEHGSEAYRHYRTLLRRLVSLENALDVLAGSACKGAQARSLDTQSPTAGAIQGNFPK